MGGSCCSKLQSSVQGKRVVITGGSDGIGAHLARRLAAVGAHVILIARSKEKLVTVAESVRIMGGEADIHVADLSNDEDCCRVVAEILKRYGGVDIFISNAGRSIRRSAKFEAQDRFHDFHRLMALNYFGALRTVLGVLPSMAEQQRGHIVHVSSFGVPTRMPRFSGYLASKAAFDAALQSIAGEVSAQGITSSTVYMPLVETKLIQAVRGHSYDHIAKLSLDEACGLIERAIVYTEAEIIDIPSRFLQLLYVFRPSILLSLNSLLYRSEREPDPDGMVKSLSRRTGESRKIPFSVRFLCNLMGVSMRFDMCLFTVVGFRVSVLLKDIFLALLVLSTIVVHLLVSGLMNAWACVRCLMCCGRGAPKGRSDRLASTSAAKTLGAEEKVEMQVSKTMTIDSTSRTCEIDDAECLSTSSDEPVNESALETQHCSI